MFDFLENFDGSGRTPRAVQKTALEWVSSGYFEEPVAAINGPVGSGKSAVARAFQLVTGAHVLTCQNTLIDQYIDSYPTANYVKGKRHYPCYFSNLTCSDWIDVEQQPPCDRCPYQRSRARALSSEPSFFNPLSFYHLSRRSDYSRPKALVVDEAHQLGPMLMTLASKRFPKSLFQFDNRCQSEVYLSEWLKVQLGKLERLLYLHRMAAKPDREKIRSIGDDVEAIGIIKECLDTEPENYAIWVDRGMYRGRPETFLNVRPVRVPATLVQRLLTCDKLVLLSGTLLRTDIEDLTAGKKYRYLDLPSPIPKENRPVLYRPMPFPVNKDTPVEAMVECIEAVLDEFPGRNTIIHTSYDRARRMFPHFTRPVMMNTPESKGTVLKSFKKSGGIWLAAGCSEGLDLKGDLCTLNIIPHLMRPNLGDPVVKKWKALPGGKRRYALETIKVCIQSYGRSTRDPADFSTTVIMDPCFSEVMGRYADDVPLYFKEACVWES
jgi:Rad3-related DNA helicase